MVTLSPGVLTLLIPIVAFLNACNETPTEPGRAVSNSGTVHILLLNASTSDLGLPTLVPEAGVIGPVAVKPGERRSPRTASRYDHRAR